MDLNTVSSAAAACHHDGPLTTEDLRAGDSVDHELFQVIVTESEENVLEILRKPNNTFSHKGLNLSLLEICGRRQGNCERLIDELLNAGANIEAKTENGWTPLLLAADNGNFYAIGCLIRRKADMNHQNNEGLTALMLATKKCDKDSAQLLLNAGADVNAASNRDNEMTALSLLYESRCEHMPSKYMLMNLLLDRGASSSTLKPNTLLDLIRLRQLNLVPKLVSSGFGPAEISSDLYLLESCRQEFPLVSPLVFTLLKGFPKVARYFIKMWFLTTSDIQLQRKKAFVKKILKQRGNKECEDIFGDFCSQPMSLQELSFVTVSSAIGCVPGRDEKVKQSSSLPELIQKMLLFKHQKFHLDIPESSTTSKGITYTYAFNLLSGT